MDGHGRVWTGVMVERKGVSPIAKGLIKKSDAHSSIGHTPSLTPRIARCTGEKWPQRESWPALLTSSSNESKLRWPIGNRLDDCDQCGTCRLRLTYARGEVGRYSTAILTRLRNTPLSALPGDYDKAGTDIGVLAGHQH